MKIIHYVEIENFKTFGKMIRIDLAHPAVLIGPNNAGKTSAIQALSLWNRGIKSWYERKGQTRSKKPRERLSAGINRLNILDVPVSETRFFWNDTRTRKGNTPIELTINLGIEYKGEVSDCRFIFTSRDSEVIYCKPCRETIQKEELLEYAAHLKFNLLYPMSGIMAGVSAETEEPPLPDGRIDVYLGQGQTAQVLRNICYKVIEQDRQNGLHDWDTIASIMKRMFLAELNKPVFNESRGNLLLTYKQHDVERELDISLAGRGMQQILLILSYLYWHKGSVLLIDEPDAHLEILRQKQVFELLREVAAANKSQVIIATHSEVILDEAVDSNLTLLINGQAVNLATQHDMKSSLRTFGIDHYYRAKVCPRILYVEGSTDFEILKSLAKKLHHPSYNILADKLNCYYTQNISSENSLENRLDRAGGAYGDYRQHFYAIRRFVPDFRGVAIFDSDLRNPQDAITPELAVLYWRDYELENYFISPDIIIAFIESYYGAEMQLFRSSALIDIKEVIDACLLEDLFKGDKDQLQAYHAANTAMKRTLLRGLKMSSFADKIFTQFAQRQKQPVLLNKGEYYQLIEYIDPKDIPDEIHEKLDTIAEYLAI